MHIIVLNGSPKGERSITMQSIVYLERKFPEHRLEIINVAHKIKRLDRDKESFQKVMNKIQDSDGVIWAFPLYYQLPPSQYKRFIELLFERDSAPYFSQKHAAMLTTSINFYDHTAHNYIHGICDDLDMRFHGTFSSEMDDILKQEHRETLEKFYKNFIWTIKNNHRGKALTFEPLKFEGIDYQPSLSFSEQLAKNLKLAIVTDQYLPNTNLGKMIDRVRKMYDGPCDLIDLSALKIKAGCQGCVHCGYEYECKFEGKDDYTNTYRDRIMTADLLIFAGTIVDRYLSSQWKMFMDRSFFRTHTPSIEGKQIGYLISGPMRQLPNLRQIFEGYCEVQKANLVDIITDEPDTSAQIDTHIHELIQNLIYFSELGYRKPPTFLGVAGWKIFRDGLWGKLRYIFPADHKYYKDKKMYDFPYKDFDALARNAVMIPLLKLEKFRKKFQKMTINSMIKPHRKAALSEQSKSHKKPLIHMFARSVGN